MALIGLGLIGLSTVGEVRSETTVRVGVYENKPKVFSDENGGWHGIYPEILGHVARAEGWKLVYVPGTWTECLDRLKTGRIDLLVSIAYSRERSRKYAFSFVSVLTDWGQVFSRPGERIDSILDLEGKKVGLLGGDIFEGSIRDLADRFNVAPRFVTTDDYDSVLEMVREGRTEAGVTSRLYGYQQAGRHGLRETPIIFNPLELRFAGPKNGRPELLSAIDQHLSRLKMERGSAYYRIIERWLGLEPEKAHLPAWVSWVLLGAGGAAFIFLLIALFFRAKVRRSFNQLSSQNEELAHQIRERLKTEKALLDSEAKFRGAFENVSVGMVMVEIDGRYAQVNQAFCEMLGYTEAELMEVNFRELTYEPDREAQQHRVKKMLQGGVRSVDFEKRYIHKEGHPVWARVSSTLLKDEQGEPRLWVTLIQDITLHKEAQAALQESEELFRGAFDAALTGLVLVDLESRLMKVNPAFCKMVGYPEAELTGTAVEDITHPDDLAIRSELIRDMIAGRIRTGHYQKRFIHKSGRIVWAQVGTALQRDAEGRPLYFISPILDITERKKTQEALAEERERLAVTLRSIADGVITTDTSGRVVLVNRAAEELWGITASEAAGRSLAELFRIVDEETRQPLPDPVAEVMAEGGRAVLEETCILIGPEGREQIVALSAAPIWDRESRVMGGVLILRDVTVKRRLEDEYQKAERLESVGFLAGGIAHDFNNILAAIVGNISLARHFIEDDGVVPRWLEEAEESAFRARNLTQELLTFAKGGAPVTKTASMADIITDSAQFVLSGSNVRGEFDLPEELWPVKVDVGQISRVVNNLVINADQAMSGGGRIRIEARNVEIGTTTEEGLLPGRYVRITFTDQGPGIEPEILKNIFDPYFSTKPQGSGLGLATAYSIVKGHHGHLAVESRPGLGATFVVLLPAAAEAPPEEALPADRPLPGQGRILVMDDEAPIREVVAEMLQYLGYECLAVADGRAAIEAFNQAQLEGRPFDAVIMDLTIPGGLGGRETLAGLRELDPAVKGIVSSGYSTDPVMASFEEYGFVARVAKPFKLSELSAILDQTLSDGD